MQISSDRSVRIALLAAAIAITVNSHAFATPIDDKHTELGGAGGFLGVATGAETGATDRAGKFRHYTSGSIYWHPSTGAHVVYGLIRRKWNELGELQSYLGYPMTDEIDTFDRSGRVSKFQGGELIWRPVGNAVSEIKSADLIVDWPFPPGQAWTIIQANAPGPGHSHGGRWAYCWDIILSGKPQAASNGLPFVAVADGRLVHAVQQFPSGVKDGNIVIQHLGAGRYASYLHIKQNSYDKRFPMARGRLPQDLPWNERPVVKSGTVLAEVSDTGAAAGAFHLHFCVTTKPDQAQFAPFESVPIAFRNYSVSNDQGRTWRYVATGVPKANDWIRREARPGPTAPQVNASATLLSFGTVKGTFSAPVGYVTPGGKITMQLDSKWGEPLARHVVPLPAGSNAPWPFEITNVPAYNNMTITAAFEESNGARGNLAAVTAPFEVRPNAVTAVTVPMIRK